MTGFSHSPPPAETTAEATASAEARPAAAPAPGWEEAKKVLIVDDEPHLLEIYKKVISRLPSRPQVRMADNATRALALLDAEPFDLLITDLRMPKIDGFQMLMSARRRLPELKTAVLTGAANEQYRTRAYEAGIDLFVEKPTTPAEFRLFAECVEALLVRGDKERGFRGIQSKSLLDLVQFECLSQKTCALKITSGSLEGWVWIAHGNVIDAEALGKRGEEAFGLIFAWKTGNFESLPGSPDRERTIFAPYESLLLESARLLDEQAETPQTHDTHRELALLATVRGVESLILIDESGHYDAWKMDHPEKFAAWTRRVLRDFQGVGDMLKAGQVRAVQAAGRNRGLAVIPNGKQQLLAGMDRKMTVKFLRKAARELALHLGEA